MPYTVNSAGQVIKNAVGSSGVNGLKAKASGSLANLNKANRKKLAGIAAVGGGVSYLATNAYANERDASQVNMYGAGMVGMGFGPLGGLGGMAAVARNRSKQNQPIFTSPGRVNNHLFPGGSHQGTT